MKTGMYCTKSDRGKMTIHAKIRHVIIARLDNFVFVKNWYSVCTHLIPFAIASLLLLTLSLPEDNLLLKLVEVLQRPSCTWLPAGLLTAVAAVIYYVAIKVQIRQAYLWSDGDRRRTIFTSLVYVILCTYMVYAVLMSASSYELTLGTILACLLVAVLSLTGIGWERPNSWVKSTDRKSPNYTDGRASAEKLTETLNQLRRKKTADKKDVEDFLGAAKKLRSSIEENLQIEPVWAKHDPQRASELLYTLIELITAHFPTDNESAVKGFTTTCKYQKTYIVTNATFKEIMESLTKYWPEWQKPK